MSRYYGCGEGCGWCGACSAAIDRDAPDAYCLECGVDLNVEPHAKDCGCSERDEDVRLVAAGVNDADL